MDSVLAKRVVKDKAFVFRKIAGQFLLVPIRHKREDVDSIFTANEVGGRIWELIDGERSLSEILAAIVEEFEVGAEEAERDLIEFVGQLEHLGAVKAV
jgi:hypothetical protein